MRRALNACTLSTLSTTRRPPICVSTSIQGLLQPRPFLPPAFVVSLLFAIVLGLVACDTNEATQDSEPEIARIAIFPDSASVETGEEVDFSVVALTASGDTVQNADLDIEWWSTDPDVFTVEDGGTATGKNSGGAYCVVEASDEAPDAALRRKAFRFVGRDSAFVHVF